MTYDLRPLVAPRAAGRLLRTLVAVIENPLTRSPLLTKLHRDMGLTAFRERALEGPVASAHPLFDATRNATGEAPRQMSVDEVVASLPPRAATPGFAFATSADYVAAYRGEALTPDGVADRVIAATRASRSRSPSMAFFIAQDEDDLRAQAHASTERYKAGRPLGPLDGVPIAVKDELDQAGYGTTVGTRFLGTARAARDAHVVARLREAGAMLIGKANMHEIGIGVTGVNPHWGAVRNPYDTGRATGGSSSGSAALVAAGLCPIAVGADGGGSVRVPASYCGVMGLKATFGRVSETGAAELCWSVAHVGPIAATVRDLALAYGIMAGPDPADRASQNQPTPDLAEVGNTDLRGTRVGVYRPWFDDAEPDVVARCRDALEALRARGAEVVDVEIPDLAAGYAAHLITIASEMADAHRKYVTEHRTHYGHDTRFNLAIARSLYATDYVHAARFRVHFWNSWKSVLEQVHVVATPSTGRTAPPIADDSLETGESNAAVLSATMRFATPGNLTGHPAVSVVAGYDARGLPVGFQLTGRPWEESRLLRLAGIVEGAVTRRSPAVHYDLLGAAG